jgi:pyruvate dehydrogenase E1 component
MREMLVEQQDVFYYVTLMNENYAQPNLQAGSREAILKGCYKLHSPTSKTKNKAAQISLMGSGAILLEVMKAAEILASQGIEAEVFSVTSWSELARDGQQQESLALAGEACGPAFVHEQMKSASGPIIAATDYVRAVPESIRAFLPAGRRYITLGTDGFGRSDTRAQLRAFFQVDAASVVQAARHALGLPRQP